MAGCRGVMHMCDQSNVFILRTLLAAHLALADAPERRDRRRSDDLPWAIAECQIAECVAELARRRDPAYVAARDADLMRVFGPIDTGIEVVQ